MIETNQTHLDLGEVQLGSDTPFEVRILNTYASPKLVTTQFSCGACTSLLENPGAVPPGREGTFRFNYHPTATGSQVKTIFFQIDGETKIEYLFKANVV